MRACGTRSAAMEHRPRAIVEAPGRRLCWRGRIIWIVQDLLADYVRTQTVLPLDDVILPDWTPDEVNMVVADLNGPVAL